MNILYSVHCTHITKLVKSHNITWL